MKTIFTSIILLVTFNLVGISNAKAQFVTIPDPNFRTWLIQQYPSCFNASQQMDTTCSEIVNEDTVIVSNLGIQNLTGIQYFDSLITLKCYSNFLTSLPTLPNTLLELSCSNNQLTTLPSLPDSLQLLLCPQNQLSSLSPLPSNLITLYCSYNPLSSLPALSSTMIYLYCDMNQLSSLPTLPNTLQFLSCHFNQLTSLPSLPNSLSALVCEGNQLTSLPTLPNSLVTLGCGTNQLTSLPELPNTLEILTCDYNQITNLPILPNSLGYLNFENNQISSLPVLPSNLNFFSCSNNQLLCLPQLPSTLVDTGRFDISNNQFTCLPNYVAAMQPADLVIPLCAAGNANGCPVENGIVGKVYKDIDGNCTLTSSDSTIHNIPVKFYNPITNVFGTAYSAANGVYNYVCNIGTNIVLVDTLNKPYKANCSYPGIDSTVVTTAANPLAQNVNFDIACKGGIDLGVQSISHGGIIFPGQPHTLQIICGDASQWYGLNCNAGASGQVTITVNGPVTFAGVPLGAFAPSISGNVYTYNITDFGAVNSQTAFKLLFTTDTTAQSGDNVCVNVNISATSLENDTLNNNSYLCYDVVNSYDPNYKEVYPINVEPGFNDWLTYTIHFQNLGTAPAFNIRVLDTLNTNLDEQTFEVINYSHYNETTLQNHIVNFRFPNIMLPDSASNPSGSQGFVQYRIKPLQNLPVGTQIENTAHIYFDFNPAIVTNTTVNEYVTTVTASAKNIENDLRISPNPSNGVFYVGSNTKVKSLEVFDCVGNLIVQKNNANNFDLSNFSDGIYFVRVNGNQYSKVIKN